MPIPFFRRTVLFSLITSSWVGGSPVQITATHDHLQGLGLTSLLRPDPTSYRLVPGPLPGVVGLQSSGTPVSLEGRLARPMGDTGSLTFWFATDRTHRSGRYAIPLEQTLLELRDAFRIRYIAEATSVTLMVEWGGPNERVFERHIRIILPEFPGPAWHHFGLSWNGPAGEINAYLNGTPYYVPGEKVAPLKVLAGNELIVHLSSMALADVRLQADHTSAAAMTAHVPAPYRGQLDGLLGAQDLGPLNAAEWRGDSLYVNALTSAEAMAGWVLEGPGAITWSADGMEMKSQRPNGPQGHLVHWCPVEFPDNLVAEWEFELLEEKGLCILFFAAKGTAGRDLFDSSLSPRTGVFQQYIQGDIDCYHISYFAHTPSEPRRVANLRKNHGFHLISNGPVGVPTALPGTRYHALLVKNGAHIRMAVNGRKIIDHIDDGQRAGPAYREGRIGFRQMQWTSARYRNFRVSTLK